MILVFLFVTKEVMNISIIESNGERFIRKTYNGISILVREKSGYVNASKVCMDNGKKLNDFMRGQKWGKLLSKYTEKLYCGKSRSIDFSLVNEELKEGYCPIVYGTYVHPRLIHHVAHWANIDYAIDVEEIMFNIDAAIHVELEEKKLPDTPENAKPLVEKVKKTLREELLETLKTAKEDSCQEREMMATLSALDDDGHINEQVYEEQMKRLDWKMF
jgi:hypothetical protein